MNPCRKAAASAFTLIELLVVVAIIAILISILVPAMKGARDQAKQLLCNTNLRPMGEAAHFYATEYRDWFVRHNDDSGRMHFAASFLINLKPDKRIDWWDGRIEELWNASRPDRLAEVCRAVPQYQCPSHPEPQQPLDYVVNGFPSPYTRADAARDVSGGGRRGDRFVGQSGNHWLNYYRFTGQGVNGLGRRVTTDVVAPADRVYVIEGHVSLPTNELRFHDLFYTSQLPFGAFPRIANDRRHPGGINALFFDGSARTMPFQSLDSGFGNTIGHRLRWFTSVERELL